jgi:hypothetical protein
MSTDGRLYSSRVFRRETHVREDEIRSNVIRQMSENRVVPGWMRIAKYAR